MTKRISRYLKIKKISFFFFYTTSLSFISTASHADEFSTPRLTYSQSDFGGVGLMQMPSGRMMSEGELSFNITHNDNYINYSLSLQLYPWLESTIRYSQVYSILYSDDESFSGDTDYTDKSIDLKLRLLQETYWLPQFSLGFRDIGGSGLFDGEFVAANKQIGPWDFTLGIGWGYIGNRGNLSGDKSDSSGDCGRNTSYDGSTGTVDIHRIFKGCSSVYGGVEYQTPFKPLVLKLEYDGNDYQSDFPAVIGTDDLSVSTPWNIGLIYKLTDWARLRISYERGNTLTTGISLGTNLGDLMPEWIDAPRPNYQPHVKTSSLSDKEWQQLTEDLTRIAGYQQVSLYQDQTNRLVTLEGSQKKYRDRKESEERAAVLIANTGLDVNTYRIIETAHKQPLTETRIDANAFKHIAENDYPDAKFDNIRITQSPKPTTGKLKAQAKDNWQFGFSPALQQSFGNAEGFYLYAIGVKANSSYQFGNHILLSSGLYGNITDNYDKYRYTVPPDGTDLKRVRTLARLYYDHVFRLNNLQLTYFDRFAQNIYGQAYGGYLESMFAGLGGELIYRPLGKNWAIGIDGNYVKQRDPDSTFRLYTKEHHFDPQSSRFYRVQTGALTGHTTLYWQPQSWTLLENSLLKVSAGQYLTEDKGITVDFSKQFNNGVTVGIFATKTDLSASEYGEGSFTKGVYVSIPIDLMTIKPSTNRISISWLPLMRDGGQKLNRQYQLYNMTDARSPWFTRPVTE
jgi:hypothetical protein